MKRLVFIVEGDSELRFVKEVLGPYFHSSGLYNGIQCFKLKHSGGGISKYTHGCGCDHNGGFLSSSV